MTQAKQFRASLTLGATGMLSGALTFLAERSEKTLVLSRHGRRFADQTAIKGLEGDDVDYSDAERFWDIVNRRVNLADLDVALLWVHDAGKEVLIELIKQLTSRGIRTVHVAGSATGNPARQLERITKYVDADELTNYIPVVLGAVKTDTGQRWLTHDEISAGAIKAIDSGEPQMVGTPLEDL